MIGMRIIGKQNDKGKYHCPPHTETFVVMANMKFDNC